VKIRGPYANTLNKLFLQQLHTLTQQDNNNTSIRTTTTMSLNYKTTLKPVTAKLKNFHKF